jgi:hypothetical protein
MRIEWAIPCMSVTLDEGLITGLERACFDKLESSRFLLNSHSLRSFDLLDNEKSSRRDQDSTSRSTSQALEWSIS